MTKSSDPTLTLTLRNRATSEVGRRFEAVRRAVAAAFSLGDYTDMPLPYSSIMTLGTGIVTNAKKKPTKKKVIPKYKSKPLKSITGKPSKPTWADTNAGYVYQNNDANLQKFSVWLKGVIDREVLQPAVPVTRKWLTKYLAGAYSKGIQSTRSKAIPAITKKGVLLSTPQPFNSPAHIQRATTVYTRAFNDMEGVTNAMRAKMNSILADGMLKGKNPNLIGKELSQQVNGIGKVRGRLIARTEVVRSHQEAAIQEAMQLESESGLDINMEWSTCMDGRERQSHAARNGHIYTKEAVRSLIGEPNCRCSVNPHVEV